METIKKWLLILAAVVFAGSLFADKVLSFYIDWLWFESHGITSVLWTILVSQFGFGLLISVLFFLITFGFLNHVYKKTSHLPVLLSDQVRRDVPLLDILASNLKVLILSAPLVLAVMTGLVMAQQWEIPLQYLNASPYGEVDPIYGKDISFYFFTLPFWLLVKSLLWETMIVLSLGVGIIYFFKRFIYVGPTGVVLLPDARRTLSGLAGLFFLLFASEFYLQRYELLTEGGSLIAGIGFSDDNGKIPVLYILVFTSLISALFSFMGLIRPGMKKIMLSGVGLALVFFVANFYPKILQRFVVVPNELVKEAPYIEHTIAGALTAYGLSQTETHELSGSAALTADSIRKNATTIENIRLWDQEPLLDTLGQIQEIRTYYQFQSVDNDRYRINGDYRQTLLSPRELLSSNLPNRTWINEHLTFTHGYGVALSPVNQVTPEGLPVLLIKDIPPQSSIDLVVSRPEIYFGELANDHVFVNTGTKEFDYPEGEKNVYKNYEGKGGFLVGSFFRKLVLAARFKALKILFSEDINADSRVLMYRNITDRVQKVVPFLRLDSDPYLVISEGRLIWLYDAYTVSDHFPYSPKIPRFGNYVRNSVKISIDAYDGSMNFYVADKADPVIQTYRNIFPDLFQNLSQMPEDLRSHIRYPSDLFRIQTHIYATYHMKRPQVFYNKEDQWEIPEIDGNIMKPYYTIMKLPGEDKEEYILMLPYTPRGKSNLSAWMVARSDGEQYGKLDVYTFPKQKLIFGPSQIVARINQDAEISRQISLWDQRGSSVIQGTLLVIPIEESLVYVRPLYLKADAGKIPELKRVIVGYEDTIAMERTLDSALEKIFTGFAREPRKVIGQPVAGVSSSSTSQAARDQKLVLSKSDYDNIRNTYRRIVEAQGNLDQSLAQYRKDLAGLGELLEEAQVLPPVKAVPAP
ncbi:MAG: membrane protein [Nitrospinae bacterium CG22_combo_CG10-13_8_21_14_all_47_10]|nr:MAG: membrane protein [Nitrospinae bacterium CG22_combo_CG10-13_8_21_14_all_47_10]